MSNAANNTDATQTITTSQGFVIVSRYFDETHRTLRFCHMGLDMVVTNEEAARLAEGHRAEGGRVA